MTHFISLLAGLGHAHDQSEAKVQEYLADLLPEERHILLKRASAELSIYSGKADFPLAIHRNQSSAEGQINS